VLQGKACREAANDVVRTVTRLMLMKRGQLFDDVSCMVIDCKPHAVRTFKGYNPDASLSRASLSAMFPYGSADPSVSTNNSGGPSAAAHGAHRGPGGGWERQLETYPSFVGHDDSRDMEKFSSGKRPARVEADTSSGKARSLFCCCSSSPVKDHDSGGEVEAAFGPVRSTEGEYLLCFHVHASAFWAKMLSL
jgi:hypothetical protein